MDTLILLLIYPIVSLWLLSFLTARPASITRSGAYPNRVNALLVTHYIELSVHKPPLIALAIDIPPGIQIHGRVTIIDSLTKPIASHVTILPDRLTLQFVQPVLTAMTFTIRMEGISTRARSGSTWHYHVYSGDRNNATQIFLGIARIQTYKEAWPP